MNEHTYKWEHTQNCSSNFCKLHMHTKMHHLSIREAVAVFFQVLIPGMRLVTLLEFSSELFFTGVTWMQLYQNLL